MRIAQTRFRNFRNLENALIAWDPGLNLLNGANGTGKTNVLEALHVVTGWGAFSGSKCADTVKWDSEGGASLAAQATGEREVMIEAVITIRASLRLDGRSCRWGDLRSCVPSLTFLPSDMALIEGAPSVRRRFLDLLCALYFPLYAYKLSEYRKIMQHRRHLLGLGHSTRVTEETMANLSAWLWECRLEVIAALRVHLEKWRDLLPRTIGLNLKRGGGGNADDLLEDFHRSCAILAERERASGLPLVGPHRDDLILACEGRPAPEVLSRGQRRRTALALIMAAASAVERRNRASPVLLFDEVASELDGAGRTVLMECLRRSNWQVFAATAETTLPWSGGTRWLVSAGKIQRVD